MSNIISGIIILSAIGGATIWRRLARVKTGKGSVKSIIFSLGIALGLLVLAFFAWRIGAYNEAIISAEPQTTTTDLANNPTALFTGSISRNQHIFPNTDYVAYHYWEGNNTIIKYESPDLLIILADDSKIIVDGLIYDKSNWHETPREKVNGDPKEFGFVYLAPVDPIVVFGDVYEGSDGWHVSSEFVFQGDYGQFLAGHLPPLQRVTTKIKIARNVALIMASLLVLPPIFWKSIQKVEIG